MQATNVSHFKTWLKDHPNRHIRQLFYMAKKTRGFELPSIAIINIPLYHLYSAIKNALSEITRVFLNTPAFKGRVQQCGRRLYLYTGVPYISGPLHIEIGDDCRISGQTTFSGRSASGSPMLRIGNNVGIGWQTTIAVGSKVIIEDNVRIAGRSGFYGYPGHPIDAKHRAEGAADTDDQIGEICLKRDVWLASNVSVMAGVTIGQGTIVAAGSIVTKDLPPFVLAGGNPARVIKSLIESQPEDL
ncbi:acetyltransferase [Vibrio sp. MACH09]|uniref:acyltransferase n=1 Tax=Vibrio sp. MACH09 TaxID=3025122 RepID=UPI00279301CF|nr:acyltransferase [Vibrio sp. MACH09]GLO63435.1 acetyltransferase [Vibrio sp. MACH09]